MITLLTGDNTFETKRALDVIISDFDGRAEVVDGDVLQVSGLPDILIGVSLFADKRLVVIKDLSANKSVWAALSDWLDKVSDDIHLVLVDTKPDKRTNTYKSIKSKAAVQEFALWSDRDSRKAENWLIDESKEFGIDLKPQFARQIVQRIGVDQWQLYHALQKLSLMGDITAESINDAIELSPVESAFGLLETAISGDYDKLKQSIHSLKQTDDVFRLFALVSSQVFQLTAIVHATRTDNIAKDFGIHPYAVSKMSDLAKNITKSRIKSIVNIISDADINMKTSAADPWVIVETALLKIASL